MGKTAAQSVGGVIRTFAIGRRPEWTIARILILVILTFVLFKYVLLLRTIESISMLPNYREGSIHVINRLAYSGNRKPQRGDVVAIRTSGVTVMYVKRIIGLPGESIEIRNGKVFVDGQELEEPYARLRSHRWNWPVDPPRPRKLDAEHYFIVGDNRSMRQELHEFGVVEARRIVGKVVW